MDNNLNRTLQNEGFARLTGFFHKEDVECVRADAKWVFVKQMMSQGFVNDLDP